MCGLYGFLGDRADVGLLAELAHLADLRGGHAHGWATTTHDHKERGLFRPDCPLPTGTVIGHARLATSGAYDDLRCAQPLRAGSWSVAHNGTIPDVSAHVFRHRLTYPPVDSALLPELFHRADTLDGVVECLEDLTGGLPLALLALRRDGLLLAARRGHPLYAATLPEGTYFCTAPFPGAALLPDASAAVYHGGHTRALALSTGTHLKRHDGGPRWSA